MKKMLFSIGFLVVASLSKAGPATPSHPSIIVISESSALVPKNIYMDPRDGKIHGTIYLSFGSRVPRLPHVHVYALNASNKIIHESCDKLNEEMLMTKPRLGQGRATFFGDIPRDPNIATIKVVVSIEDDDCKLGPPLLDFPRLFKFLFKR
ncbi:MAG: hypothetical protein ABI254_11675 [Chthoniobacterales bacterium]